MDKDRRRRDVIRMKAGKVRKKVLALLLAGTAILGLTGGGSLKKILYFQNRMWRKMGKSCIYHGI